MRKIETCEPPSRNISEMHLNLFGSEGDLAIFYLGTSDCGPAVESMFREHEAVVKVIANYCDNCGEK